MALILDGSLGVPVTTVTGTLPVANGGTGVATSTGSGANALATSPTLTTPVLSGSVTGTYTLAGTPTITSPTITGATMTTMASSVITAGTAVATTSGTSVDFTSIPSWVKRITVMFQGVSTNGNSNYLVQIGTSGGIQSTGYTSGAWDNNTSTSSSTAGFILRAANNAGYPSDGLFTLCLLNASTGLWAGASVLTSGASLGNAIGTGAKTLSGTLDRVRLTSVTPDTFDAGSINILYE